MRRPWWCRRSRGLWRRHWQQPRRAERQGAALEVTITTLTEPQWYALRIEVNHADLRRRSADGVSALQNL